MHAFCTGSLGSQSLGKKQCAREREKLHTGGCGVGGRGQGAGRARDEAGKGGGNYVEAFGTEALVLK